MVANLEEIVKNLIDTTHHMQDAPTALEDTIQAGINATEPVSPFLIVSD
jgi:hypothetical protein